MGFGAILPNNVQIRDVANVLGKLAGLPSRQVSLGGETPYSILTEVRGVTIRQYANMEGYFTIETSGRLGTVSYHMETSRGGPMVSFDSDDQVSSNDVMRGLVDFFGGTLYSDQYCKDDRTILHQVPPKSNDMNRPEDGEAWLEFQNRIHALTPPKKASHMVYLNVLMNGEVWCDKNTDLEGATIQVDGTIRIMMGGKVVGTVQDYTTEHCELLDQ